VLPVLLLMVKRGIERVFLSEYPKVFDTEAPVAILDVRHEYGAQLVMHINILCRNLLDPDNIFAHFGALDTSPEAVRLWRRLRLFQASRGMALPARLHSEAHRPTQLVRTLLEAGGAAEWRNDVLCGSSSAAEGCGGGGDGGDGGDAGGVPVDVKMGPADSRTRKALFKCHSEGALKSTKTTPEKVSEGYTKRHCDALYHYGVASTLKKARSGSLNRPLSVDATKRRRGNEVFSTTASRPTSAVERYGQNQRRARVVSGF